MPIHDWSRVDASVFHDFHQAWTIEIRNALNAGRLPDGYFAMTDQIIGGAIPDVVTLQARDFPPAISHHTGGIAVADAPPKAQYMASAEMDVYASRANRIAIKHGLGHVVAVVEIVSPGNKSGQRAFRSFVSKTEQLLYAGIHLTVVDLIPPSVRDPNGIHAAIWNEISDEQYHHPLGKNLTVAAYCAGEVKRAYVEAVAVGDSLPSLPIFLDETTYIPAPLEETYEAAWQSCPKIVRDLVAGLNP